MFWPGVPSVGVVVVVVSPARDRHLVAVMDNSHERRQVEILKSRDVGYKKCWAAFVQREDEEGRVAKKTALHALTFDLVDIGIEGNVTDVFFPPRTCFERRCYFFF